MRIAILTSGILPIPAVLGGAVENLIDYYLEYNNQHQVHDVTVYSVAPPHSTAKAESLYTHYHYINTRSLWHRLKRAYYMRTHKNGYYNGYIEYFLHEALKHIKRQKFDAIILENRPGYAIPVSEVTDARIILHLHNDFFNSESKDGQAIIQVTDTVITVSDFIKRRVESLLSIQPFTSSTKIHTVHNGIDLQRFYNATPLSRASLGFKESDFIVVYSGRINPDKGVKELIQAFKLLKDCSNIKLMIVGGSFFGNEQGNDPFVQSLQEEAKELTDVITFTGYIPYEQIQSYLKMADVAVVPSMCNEAFALTLVEAMAIGLPVIATNMGAIAEVSQGNAIIVNKTSAVTEIAQSILKLYNSPSLRTSMRNAGLTLSQQYAKERYAKDFFQIISSLSVG